MASLLDELEQYDPVKHNEWEYTGMGNGHIFDREKYAGWILEQFITSGGNIGIYAKRQASI